MVVQLENTAFKRQFDLELCFLEDNFRTIIWRLYRFENIKKYSRIRVRSIDNVWVDSSSALWNPTIATQPCEKCYLIRKTAILITAMYIPIV